MWLAILAAAAVAAPADAPAAAPRPATEVAPVTATAPAKPEKAKKDEVVCVNERMTGSNRLTKVCYSPRAQKEETRNALEGQHVRGSDTPGIGTTR